MISKEVLFKKWNITKCDLIYAIDILTLRSNNVPYDDVFK